MDVTFSDKPEISEKIEKTYLVFSFLYLIILYFYEFNQGDSSVPLALRSVKEVLFIAISAFFVIQRRIHKSSFIYLWVYILLISIYSTIVSENAIFLLEGKSLIIYMCLTFFWFKGENKGYFFKIKNPLILFQLGVSLFVYLFGFHLWEEKEFVGTMGNPNCAGLFANIVFFITLNQKVLKKWDHASLGASLICVLFCKALSQQLIFLIAIFINAFFFILHKRFDRLKLVLVSVSSFIFVCLTTNAVNTYVLIGFLNKIASLFFNVEFEHQTVASSSITGRLSNLTLLQHRYEKGTWQEIIFGFVKGNYFKSDALYFILVINYGLLGLLLFLVLLIKLGFKSIIKAFKFKEPETLLIVLIFALTFVFTRALYYFPVCILFYVLYSYYDQEQ